MRVRVRGDQRIGSLAATDEAEHVDEPGLHDGGTSFAPRAGDEIDHSRRQDFGKGVGGEDVCEASDPGQLEDGDVPHEQRL